MLCQFGKRSTKKENLNPLSTMFKLFRFEPSWNVTSFLNAPILSVNEEYCMKILALCQRLDKIRHAQTFSFLRLFFWKQGLNEQKYWFWLKCVIFTSGLNYQDSLSKFQSYWLARPLEVVGRAAEILHVLLPYLTKLAIWECLIRRKIFTHDGLQVNKGLTFSNRVQHQM